MTDIPVHFDFLFSDSHAEVISGKQEGWYQFFSSQRERGPHFRGPLPTVHCIEPLETIFLRDTLMTKLVPYIAGLYYTALKQLNIPHLSLPHLGTVF